jgi:hypothetical protein
MMLPGEVGAKISERDRLLREKQLRDAQSQRTNQGRQGALRGIPLPPRATGCAACLTLQHSSELCVGAAYLPFLARWLPRTHTLTRTGFHDVAHDGALFSPTRKGAFFDGESVDEDIEDELLPKKGAALSGML